MSLEQIGRELAERDGRNAAYLYHAAIVAARSLGIFGRGRVYTADEARAISARILILFPGRD